MGSVIIIAIVIIVAYCIIKAEDPAKPKRTYSPNEEQLIREYKSQGLKYCPFCLSTQWQYAGQQTYGGRNAKVKTQHSLNLNPLKPFTIINSKEKVVRQAVPGVTYDEFICLKCGKRFR